MEKKLDENNIKYFLICGDLIGYHRHNKGFILSDDDDIAVFEEDREKLHNILKEMIKENLNLTFNINVIDKVMYGAMDDNPIQINIFYIKYYEKENMYSYYSNELRKKWPREKISKDEIFPLKEVDYILYSLEGNIMKTMKVKIPNKSINYLDRAYPQWQNKFVYGLLHNIYYNLMFNFPFTVLNIGKDIFNFL